MTVENPERLLTPGEVALMFRVDPKTVTRWASAGRIGSIRTPRGAPQVPRVGGRWSARRPDRRLTVDHRLNNTPRAESDRCRADAPVGPGLGRVGELIAVRPGPGRVVATPAVSTVAGGLIPGLLGWSMATGEVRHPVGCSDG